MEPSLTEALYASPSLGRLLNLLDYGSHQPHRQELISEALARFEAIKARRDSADVSLVDLIRSWDLRENSVPEGLEIYRYLLMGDYARVASLMADSTPLGWSYGQNPNAIVVPFSLYARWDPQKRLAANMADLWNGEIRMEEGFSSDWPFDEDQDEEAEDLDVRLRNYLGKVLVEYPPLKRRRTGIFKLLKRRQGRESTPLWATNIR